MYEYEEDEAKQNQNPPPARHSYGSCGSCETLTTTSETSPTTVCTHNKVNNNKARGDPQTEIRQSAVGSRQCSQCSEWCRQIRLQFVTLTQHKKSVHPPKTKEGGWDAKESPVLWLYKSGIWYLVAGIINLTREMPGKLAHKSDGLKSIGWKGKRPNDGPGGMVQSNQNQYKQKGKGNYTSLLAHAHILFCSLTLSHSISFFCSLCDQLIYQSQWKTRPSGIKRQWRSIHKLLINCQLTIVLGSQSLLPPEAAAVALDISWCCCILWSAGKGKTFDFY